MKITIFYNLNLLNMICYKLKEKKYISWYFSNENVSWMVEVDTTDESTC